PSCSLISSQRLAVVPQLSFRASGEKSFFLSRLKCKISRYTLEMTRLGNSRLATNSLRVDGCAVNVLLATPAQLLVFDDDFGGKVSCSSADSTPVTTDARISKTWIRPSSLKIFWRRCRQKRWFSKTIRIATICTAGTPRRADNGALHCPEPSRSVLAAA